jgi:translation initiation factor IF-3
MRWEKVRASKETRQLAKEIAKEIMDRRMPADQRRLIPKIAWRRFIESDPHKKIAPHFRGQAMASSTLQHPCRNRSVDDARWRHRYDFLA